MGSVLSLSSHRLGNGAAQPETSVLLRDDEWDETWEGFTEA